MAKLELGSQPCQCGQVHDKAKLIAITGGPGAGKTAVLEMARRSFCSHVGILPESASVLFSGGFPRHDTDAGRRAAQRAIFWVQRELEELVLDEGQVGVALCDRGTVDGAAYWPGDRDEFWDVLGTTLQEQLNRYSAVIHLQTPALGQGYNYENTLRIETAEEARDLDRKIEQVWRDHPHRLLVGNEHEFLDKAYHALQFIRAELPACCHVHSLVTGADRGGDDD